MKGQHVVRPLSAGPSARKHLMRVISAAPMRVIAPPSEVTLALACEPAPRAGVIGPRSPENWRDSRLAGVLCCDTVGGGADAGAAAAEVGNG